MSIPSIFSDDTEPSLAWVTPTLDWRVKLNASNELEFSSKNTTTTVLTLKPTGEVSLNNYSFPIADGTVGQVLQTDGAGALAFASAAGIGDLLAANNLNDVANVQLAIDNLTKTSTVDVNKLTFADTGLNSNKWTIEEENTNRLLWSYAGAKVATLSATGIIKGFDSATETVPGGNITLLGGAGNTSVGGTVTVQGGTGNGSNDGGDILIIPGTAGVTGGPGSIVISGLTWPATDGAAGQTVGTDGAGNLSFSDVFDGFDVAFFVGGIPNSSQISGQFIAVRNFDLPINLTGSAGFSAVAATASTNFDIQKNGASIGTMNFAISATTATFTFTSGVSFVIDDILRVIAPAIQDVTLSDVSMTFKGTRV